MARLSVKLTRGDMSAPFDIFRKFAEQKIESAALRATDRGIRSGVTKLRAEMSGARLGRLGQAIALTSDQAKGQGVFRFSGGWSASGVAFVRSKSDRTRGAIEAYTKGAEIRPKRSRWLWIATDQIPRVTGRYRMTPELYNRNGFDRKIGPLVRVNSKGGTPLLIVRNVGVSLAGKKRSAKSLTKRGLARRGQLAVSSIVAFIGIPRTSRTARVDPSATFRSVQAELPELFNREVKRS